MARDERARFLRQQLKEYLSTRTVTPEERQELEHWVRRGFSVYENPWYVSFEDGWPADYLWAKRFDDELMETMGQKEAE